MKFDGMTVEDLMARMAELAGMDTEGTTEELEEREARERRQRGGGTEAGSGGEPPGSCHQRIQDGGQENGKPFCC